MPITMPPLITRAQSDDFEVVGRLDSHALTLLIDRTDSNEPVLNATLEIESAGKSVHAVFRPETGDYRIEDPAWLNTLRTPGEHPLAFTVQAGNDSDLLASTLTLPPHTLDTHMLWQGLLLGLLITGMLALSWRFRHGLRQRWLQLRGNISWL